MNPFFYFQVIFAQPSNLALYCAQVLELRLEERTQVEQEVARQEKEQLRLVEEKQRKIELAKEDFRKKSKNVTTKRNCESQTGFTTDSGNDSSETFDQYFKLKTDCFVYFIYVWTLFF